MPWKYSPRGEESKCRNPKRPTSLSIRTEASCSGHQLFTVSSSSDTERILIQVSCPCRSGRVVDRTRTSSRKRNEMSGRIIDRQSVPFSFGARIFWMPTNSFNVSGMPGMYGEEEGQEDEKSFYGTRNNRNGNALQRPGCH